MLNVFIGYDPREHEAYKVCANSIARRSEAVVHRLDDRHLRRIGLYTRPYLVTETGQYIDKRDGRPFSTMFAFTRFMVPYLAKRLGIQDQWVMFADCDFIFLRPLEELFALVDDRYAVMCVKHNHVVGGEHTKMDGVVQGDYNCKNWSSLFLWNMHHGVNDAVGDVHVNYSPGQWLHRFGWIEERWMIGSIPEEWNWLAGVSPTTGAPRDLRPAAIHYTEGGPWMEGYEQTDFSDRWYHEHDQMLASAYLGTRSEGPDRCRPTG